MTPTPWGKKLEKELRDLNNRMATEHQEGFLTSEYAAVLREANGWTNVSYSLLKAREELRLAIKEGLIEPAGLPRDTLDGKHTTIRGWRLKKEADK